ncbi:MAG: FAD-dependent monooxygenase [Nannocystis sp.]|nr:FAD-dependent monooxygenase [Nannocystis sp.]
MTERTVLISGASIAGPTLAFWLRRYGLRPVVIERAGEPRLGGQNVDIRGAGREVARRMGIEAELFAASTGEKGLRFVDRHNVTRAEFPAGKSDTDGFTAELEILRGDLVRILHDRTRGGSEYIFGDYITDLSEHDGVVTATFAAGKARDFDLVIVADGVRSRTRSIVFGGEAEVREIGLYMAYLTIPRIATDSPWWSWYNAPGGRTIQLRPDNVGTTRVLLTFTSEPRGHERLGIDAQKDVLRRIFSDAGWAAPRVLAALDGATELYFDSIAQVLAPRWSRGRVALVGDAGYCPTPISGMGTSLAIVGAYVLAGEIARHEDHGQAFAAYERIMRPLVHAAQALPPGVPRLAHPKTKIGIAIFHAGARLAAGVLASRLGNKLLAPQADKFELPDYCALVDRPPAPVG